MSEQFSTEPTPRPDLNVPSVERPRARKSTGFLILVIVGVVLLCSGLVGIGVVAVAMLGARVASVQLEEAKQNAARAKAQSIQNAAQLYYLTHDEWPRNVQVLTNPDPENGGQPYLAPDAVLDPWGKPYQIEPPEEGGARPRVWTITPDGKTIENKKQ